MICYTNVIKVVHRKREQLQSYSRSNIALKLLVRLDLLPLLLSRLLALVSFGGARDAGHTVLLPKSTSPLHVHLPFRPLTLAIAHRRVVSCDCSVKVRVDVSRQQHSLNMEKLRWSCDATFSPKWVSYWLSLIFLLVHLCTLLSERLERRTTAILLTSRTFDTDILEEVLARHTLESSTSAPPHGRLLGVRRSRMLNWSSLLVYYRKLSCCRDTRS